MQQRINGKQKVNRRVCDSKKQLTNTKCKILALFVWILNNWECFLFSLSSCIYQLEQESHKYMLWHVGGGMGVVVVLESRKKPAEAASLAEGRQSVGRSGG